MNKYCKFCNTEKPIIGFSKDSHKKDGHSTKCKSCVKAYKDANAQSISERRRVYRNEHKAEISEYMKSYRPAYREKNREHLIAKSLEWAANNNEKRKVIARRSRLKHPETGRSVVRNRRARLAQSEGRHTKVDVLEILRLQKGKCSCCRSKLTAYHVDHIIPIARGGSNDKLNLQILCPPCNLKKNDKDPLDFMQSRGFLL